MGQRVGLKPWTRCSLYMGVLLLLEQPLHPGLAGLVQRGGHRVSHGVAEPSEGRAEPKGKLKKLLRVRSGSSAPWPPHSERGCSPAGEGLPCRGLSQSCAASGVLGHPVLTTHDLAVIPCAPSTAGHGAVAVVAPHCSWHYHDCPAVLALCRTDPRCLPRALCRPGGFSGHLGSPPCPCALCDRWERGQGSSHRWLLTLSCLPSALLYKPIDRVTRSTLVLHVSVTPVPWGWWWALSLVLLGICSCGEC